MTPVFNRAPEGSGRSGTDAIDVPPGVTLTHLAPTLGTEVAGLDLSQNLDDAVIGFLRRLWLQRKVIFFRNQNLTRAQHIAFGRRFGELELYPTGSDLADYPELYVFERGDNPEQRGENYWHMDTATNPRPVAGCISLLRSVPPVGGDTMFADMTTAYEGLSSWMKNAIAGLRAVQRIDVGSRKYYPNTDPEVLAKGMKQMPPVTMPLVHTHPETGLKILYCCDIWTTNIVGLSNEESDMLLKFLIRRVHKPEYQCRFRWDSNAVAFWDNRAVQHYACFDYEGTTRRLERVAFLSERDWDDVRLLADEPL